MILLSFIILRHPDWKNGDIKIFDICKPGEEEKTKENLNKLVVEGRLPITYKNKNVLVSEPDVSSKVLINKYSADAGLTMIGFRTRK